MKLKTSMGAVTIVRDREYVIARWEHESGASSQIMTAGGFTELDAALRLANMIGRHYLELLEGT